jgi:ribonuclease Z
LTLKGLAYCATVFVTKAPATRKTDMHPIKIMIPAFAVLIALLGSTPAAAQPAQEAQFKVVLLGTGSPAPILRRFGPSVLIQAGKKNLLFDVGRGATQRILQAGLTLGQIDATFLTHLHSDHLVGLPDLWLTGWLEAAYAQRKGPFVVYGPQGTQALMNGLTQAFQWDIQARIADQRLNPQSIASRVTEIKEGLVLEADGVKVTAIQVDHGELLHPAFGYRIDYMGRSVTLSGDTRFSENLIKHAAGSHLLIHQVAAANEELLKLPTFKAILDHHTLPQEAGIVFTKVQPKLAVFYHFVLLGTAKIPAVTESQVLEMTRQTYQGPLLIGEDMMAFRIDANEVIRLP